MRRSALTVSHKLYRPLFLTDEYDAKRRKLKKKLAKSSWFENSVVDSKVNCRRALPNERSGKKPSQLKVPSMKYSATFRVQSTKGGRLLKMFSKAEPQIA